jgi:ABC-type transport system involved in Fe-S cluster assembly fused permease/ATPase subunit
MTNIMQKNYWECIKSVAIKTFTDQKIFLFFCFSVIFLGIEVASNVGIPLVLKRTVDWLASSITSSESIALILTSYGALWILSQVVLHLRSLFTYRMEQRLTFVLATKILTHLYTLSHSYFLDQKTGTLTSIIRRAQKTVPTLIVGIFFHVIPTIIEFICVITIVALYYPLAYSLFMGGTLIGFLVYSSFSMKIAIKNREKANHIDQQTDGVITDWISNYESVKVFGRSDLAVQICEEHLKKREVSEVTFMNHFFLSRLGQSLILGCGLVILTYLAGKGVQNKKLTIGDFVLFNGYILQFIAPISILGHVIQDTKKAVVDMKDVIKILLTQSDVKENVASISLKGDKLPIEFRNVGFSYNNREILKDLSFTIMPGETALFVGYRGSGKSTIAKLLLRLYDPTAGNIFINQVNMKDLSFKSLYQNIGWIPQESYFLNDTIEKNLSFAAPGATLKEIEHALDNASLLDFVRSLPEGLKTKVGDRGVKLSGGEKQRLSIARLFLKKPQICIFDEATSSLDRNTELLIQNNIGHTISNMTKIIITHRPFMTQGGNQIITLKEGTLLWATPSS